MFERRASNSFRIAGRIRCLGGLLLDVEEYLELRLLQGRLRVRPVTYSYHVRIGGQRSRNIFRYDNFHAYSRERHPDAHHKHRFDPRTGREVTPPEWIGAERAPQLVDVLAELRDVATGDETRR